MPSFIERLARRVVSLETKVNRALTSPQLGSSSIENGGAIEEYGQDGQLVQIIGRQPDGTHGAVVVSGPVPPRPSAPQASGGPGLLNYAWDGVFANAATGEADETIPAPMDFARVEVHASQVSGFSAVMAETLVGTIESPRGSSNSIVADPGTWYVVLVARAMSGKASMQSLETAAEVAAVPDVDGLREDFESEMSRLDQEVSSNAQAQAQLQQTVGELRDTDLPALADNLANAQSRLDDANVLLNETFPSRFDGLDQAVSTASSNASSAITAASNAQSKADTATSAASAAQSKADTAFSEAAAAAGLAAGKGKVLVQSTAPGAEDRNAQTLWIDTTNGNNTPKRWTTGTTWVAVTDKKATDAATAAANAASAAATAKSAADAAQATANAAQTAAGNAQNTADNALTMAGSKSKVFYSRSEPSGTADPGDTWRQVDTANNVIAEWRVTSNGLWIPQKLTSEAISNLDVGKLTAGTANIVNAVAQKIAAATATFQTADIGNLTVTGSSNLNTVTAQRIASNVASFLSLTTDQLVAGTAQIDTAVMNKVFAEMFATRKLYANQVFVGHPGNMMPDPGFNDDGMTALRNQHSTVAVDVSTDKDLRLNNTSTGLQYLRPYGTPQTQAGVLAGGWIAVEPGQVWTFKFTVSAWKGTTGWAGFVGRTKDGSAYANPTARTPITTANQVVEVTGTIPANCYWMLPEVAVAPGTYSYIVRNSMVLSQKVTPSLIVDGFFQGLRVVGASIETNAAAETGFKFSDDGMTAYGTGIDYDPVGQVNLNYKTRAKLTTRATSWTSFSADRVPGLWFEATKAQTSGATPPYDPAGLIASAAHAQGLTLLSSQQEANDYRSNVTVDQNFAQMGSRSDSATAGGVPKDHTTFTAYPAGFALNVNQGSTNRLSLNYYSSTPNEVNINLNGRALKLEDTGWNTASMSGTWRHRTDYGWSGVKWRAINGVFTIMGSATKPTSWITGEVMCQIPTKYLPPHRIMGTNAYADLATQTIQPENPGAANAGLNFTVSWPYL